MRLGPAMLATVLAAVLLASGCAGGTADGGSAGGSCVAPYLDDQPPGSAVRSLTPVVQPGESVTVYGHFYTSTCNDTGGQDPLEPLASVDLTARFPGGAQADLGSFTPSGDDMGFSTTVDIPRDTPGGIAVVRDDRDPPATFAIAVRPRIEPPPR